MKIKSSALVIITVVVAVFALLFFGYNIVNRQLKNDTGRNLTYFFNLAKNSHSDISGGFNFIILGLDPRDDSLEKTLATDTIIIANFTSRLNRIKMIPLPRDLWTDETSSKINMIYSQSFDKPNRFKYISDSYQKITGVPIDRILVITTQNLIDLVNIVNGVDVNLETGFTDTKYPNPEYVRNPQPKTPVYITVSYPSGLNHLDGSNIEAFVRSRKSSETASTGGTDLGRIQRQAALIDALIYKLKQPEIYFNYQRLVSLYHFWQYSLDTNFDDNDLAAIAKKNQLALLTTKLEKFDITDSLYHPTTFKNAQWVFLPLKNDYDSLRQKIISSLKN